MSESKVGGLAELLPCPFCGSQPKLETHSQYHSYSARDAQRDGMGVSAGGFSTTSWRVDCACGISIPGNNDAFLVQRWNTRVSARGQPVVDEAMVKRAVDATEPPDRTCLDHEEYAEAILTAALTGADHAHP